MTEKHIPRIFCSAFLLIFGSCVAPGSIETYLDSAGRKFSADKSMVGMKWDGPTYHTKVEKGTYVHSTVASLDYALALFHRDASDDRQRAAAILDKVVSLQETRASHDYYGVWPWFLEEPLDQMSPPDRNWSDFCGARIAQALVVHGDKLENAVRERARRSLAHAARAIRERDVNPDYTNIAIMGGGVAVVAGELLDDPNLLRFGRQKLEKVLTRAQRTSNFREYNSPNYTLVVLWECERALHLVKDKETREAAEALRHIAWRTIAESYHPGTQQWAGPHSRAYSSRLTAGQVRAISLRTGIDMTTHPDQDRAELYPFWTTPSLPCPESFLALFNTDDIKEKQFHRTFREDTAEQGAIIGTTWVAPDVCLGSVNRACLWVQRRPLIGYWRTAEDPAVVLRLRAMKNGRDFSAIGVRNEQHGPKIFSNFYVLTDRGDWHRHLDAPENSTYRARDLRLRYELTGKGVEARKIGERRYELRAGDHRAVLHATPGEFFGTPVECRVGNEKGKAYLDIILHEGAEIPFDFRKAGIVGMAVELEILRGDAPYDVRAKPAK